MSRLASTRPRVQPLTGLRKFTIDTVTSSGEAKIGPSATVQSKNNHLEKNLTIYVPALFSINWIEMRKKLDVNLAALTKSTPTTTYSYIKNVDTGDDLIFYFTSLNKINGDSSLNYADGYNLENLSDFKKYRIRGLYKLGYRFIKEGDKYTATSFFIQLISHVARPDEYISYSTYEEANFNYLEDYQLDTESDIIGLESFKLNLEFKDGDSVQLRSMMWKCAILGGNVDTPCLNIPHPDTDIQYVSGLVSLDKTCKINVDFETYIAYEARGSSLLMYTWNPGVHPIKGGIYSMLNGKNCKLPTEETKILGFGRGAEFVIDAKSNSPLALSSNQNIYLNFVCKKEGQYEGSNFMLPFSLVDNDPSQISTYIMDDNNKFLIWNTFLFLRNIPHTDEKHFPLNTSVKWITEKLTDKATFISPGSLSYTKVENFKPVTGDMTKFFSKDNGLEFTGPNNVHLIRVKITLALPDNS